jgi:hypothetical protein
VNKPPPAVWFEGSPVSKAIEILRDCSDAEVAAVLESLGKTKRAAAEYEIYHGAALKLRSYGRGRPGYDEVHLLDEMEWRLKNGECRSIPRIASEVGSTLVDPEQRRNAATRLAKKYYERLSANNRDLKMKRTAP